MVAKESVLVTASGPSGSAILTGVLDAIDRSGAIARDIDQVELHGRVVLSVVAECATREALDRELTTIDRSKGAECALLVLSGQHSLSRNLGNIVTVLAPDLSVRTLSELMKNIESAGGRVVRTVRLSSYPVTCYELTVLTDDELMLRRSVTSSASELKIDVAVQRAGLARRAKRLVVLDADSTVVRAEVIDLLAQRSGHGEEVAAITEAAMAGKLDFEHALRKRVATLAGLELKTVEEIARSLPLMPGARTLLRTLKRLGYVTAIVSGGFTQVIDILGAELEVDYTAANLCEVRAGRLTGELLGPIVDRAGKRDALVHFAELAGVPLSQTVAVGDGANDIDMLTRAGLGVAFNAKPIVREAADASINVPYLDAVLFLFGIQREEIEDADTVDPVTD